MARQRFPILPRLAGLVCAALGLLGVGGDIYALIDRTMLGTMPTWMHITGMVSDILLLGGGIGIIMGKKSLYIVGMAACFICGVYVVVTWPLLDWNQMMAIPGYQLPKEAVSTAVFMAKTMAAILGVFLPAALLVVLACYYRRIQRDIWR